MSVVMLGPATVDIVGVRAGDQNLIELTLTTNGAPMNITGMVVQAQARLTSTSPDALSAVITVTDAARGVLEVRWPGADVTALLGTKSSWNGVWDMQVGNPGNDPVTVAAGRFVAEMDVTRSGP